MKTRLKLLAALLALAATATAADLTTIIESIDLTPTGTWDFTGGQITVNDADLPATLSRDSELATHAALTQTHGISAFGASLVDDATAANARTTLGFTAPITNTSSIAANLLPAGPSFVTLGSATKSWLSVWANNYNFGGFTDATLTRPAAGRIAVEGDPVLMLSDFKYPMFVLTPPSTAYNDFEIKASRNNFVEGAAPYMVYYFHSPGYRPEEVGTEPDVWHTDSAIDPREWVKLPKALFRTSIAANLTDVDSVAGGMVIVITDPAVVNAIYDPTLIWSITWFTASGSQADADNRSIWRPIAPTRYLKQTFTP